MFPDISLSGKKSIAVDLVEPKRKNVPRTFRPFVFILSRKLVRPFG
jgi:hypothetical protein